MSPLRAARLLLGTLAVLAWALLGWVFVARLAYPYDLEWMEGGMLTHALRLLEGKPLYAAPAVEFVPFLYTPLYPATLALLGKLVGVGYPVARVLSIASYLAASVLGFLLVRREARSWLAGLVAVAIPAAAFVPTGAWYDLARPDSLWLALTTLAIVLGWRACQGSHGFAVLAAAALVAAFFTKQTAAPLMLALGLALLARSFRIALTYLASLAALGLPLLWLLDRAYQGWFWTYVFELHQRHPFRIARGFLAAPGLLLLLLGPGLLLLLWALRRARSPALLYASWMALWGWLVSCLAYGTMWSFVNAIIPGLFFTALAIGIGAGQLLAAPAEAAPARRRAWLVTVLLGLALLFAPNGPARLILPLAPASWKMGPRAFTGYDPRAFLPEEADRRAGEQLIARLRQAGGPVLIPPHPYYARLAGQPLFLHSMGLLDPSGTEIGLPRGLTEALSSRRFAMVVLDDGANLASWPGLLQSYCLAEELSGPRMISGTPLRPRYLLLPDRAARSTAELRRCAPGRK